MLRSAVERHLEIIGGSLNRLRRVEPGTAAGIDDLPRSAAFRGVLIRGYATIDDAGAKPASAGGVPLATTGCTH